MKLEERSNLANQTLLDLRPLLLEAYSLNPGFRAAQNAAKNIDALHVATKTSFRDIVTEYDTRVEKEIIQTLGRLFPGELVIGEEMCSSLKKSPKEIAGSTDKFWLVDPIDGTTNFSRSYPYFSSTMAFIEGGEIQVAATFNPVSNEMFYARKGQGAWVNREPLRVSQVDNPQQALLTTGFASLRSVTTDPTFQLFQTLTRETLGVRRDGSAALDLAYVASGRTDAYWEWGLSAWDIAAGILLVQEAGGKLSFHDDRPLDMFQGEILATNAVLHSWMIEKLKT